MFRCLVKGCYIAEDCVKACKKSVVILLKALRELLGVKESDELLAEVG